MPEITMASPDLCRGPGLRLEARLTIRLDAIALCVCGETLCALDPAGLTIETEAHRGSCS